MLYCLCQRFYFDVFKFGVVSFLIDVSFEMIFVVFVVFFMMVVGVFSVLLGLIEGLVDFFVFLLNYFLGWLLDCSGWCKWFVIVGYVFFMLVKFILLVLLFIVVFSVFWVIECLGKGFCGLFCDVWLVFFLDKVLRGYVFGVYKVFDKMGVVIGLLVVYVLLFWLGELVSIYVMLFLVVFVFVVISVLVFMCIFDQLGVVYECEGVWWNWQ